MGCCSSRPEESDSPYDANTGSTSSRAINASHSTRPLSSNSQIAAADQIHHQRRHRDQRPLDQHISKPLRRHEWTAKSGEWTRSRIDAEREEFFDTRVTGRVEVWQTIRAALHILWESASEAAQIDDNASGLATAESILTAAEISLPTGDLVNGVYDSWGNLYQLPEWVVADPVNIEEEGQINLKGSSSLAADDQETHDGDGDDETAERRREEKGKGIVDVREQVSLRARLSETGRDVRISLAKTDTARSVARRIAQESGLSTSRKIRLVYMGKILQDGASLDDQGWEVGQVINAFVFDK